MKRFLLIPLLLTASGFAQTGPVLHSRRDEGPGARTQAVKGTSTLPENASGEYELDGQGSVIQITIEHGRLTGYVTKMDHETALTLFFERTTMDGDRLSFWTKTVHGLRYSFRGTIVRGDTESLSKDGFYRLVGKLTTYRNRGNAAERVSLKSTPRD